LFVVFFFFFQAEDGIRDLTVTGVQTCALPISDRAHHERVLRDAERAAGGESHVRRHRRELVERRAVPDEAHARGGHVPLAHEERSEERRVGKGGRGRGATAQLKKKGQRRG